MDDILSLMDVTHNSLSNFFRYIDCREFEISYQIIDNKPKLSEAEIKGLSKILNSKVEKLVYSFGNVPIFPCIEDYDGKGKCQEIEVEYLTNQDEESSEQIDPNEKGYKDFKLDLENIKDWSESRGWSLSVKNNSHDWLKTKIINIKRK